MYTIVRTYVGRLVERYLYTREDRKKNTYIHFAVVIGRFGANERINTSYRGNMIYAG